MKSQFILEIKKRNEKGFFEVLGIGRMDKKTAYQNLRKFKSQNSNDTFRVKPVCPN